MKEGSAIRLLVAQMARIKWRIMIFVGLGFILWGFSILLPRIVSGFMDQITKFQSKEGALHFGWLFIGVTVGSIIGSYLVGLYGTMVKTSVGFNLSIAVIEHVKLLPLDRLKKFNAAYLTQRIDADTNTLTGFALGNAIDLIIELMTFFFVLVIVFKMSVKVGLCLFCSIPLYAILFFLFRKQVYQRNLAFKERDSEFFNKLNDQIDNIKIIKINAWFDLFRDELKAVLSSLYAATMDYARTLLLLSNLRSTLTSTTTLLIFAIGGFEVLNHKLSIGDFIALNLYYPMVLSSVGFFLNVGKDYQAAKVAYYRLKELLDINAEENGIHVPKRVDSIEMRNVTFAYEKGGPAIIDRINYCFKKGHVYCIAGSNGAGKSTFINLLIGLYRDYEGSIMYNSIDISAINLYKVREKLIGIAEQEPALLRTTIKRNLTYGIANIKDITLLDIITKVGLQPLIRKLPQGLETDIYEKAKNISGGEKQKLSLARVLLKDPDIVILDEPTSALDRRSVDTLLSLIKKIKKNKIIILVSHDQSVINAADEVICF